MSWPAAVREIKDVGATGVGAGEDSQSLRDEYERSLDHFYIPLSSQWSRPEIRFNTLKAEWENDTGFFSSITEIAMHPAYQQIIGMGPMALPYIFDAMREKQNLWFWALKAITGDDPVLPEQRGKIKEMTTAWLRYAEQQGY